MTSPSHKPLADPKTERLALAVALLHQKHKGRIGLASPHSR